MKKIFKIFVWYVASWVILYFVLIFIGVSYLAKHFKVEEPQIKISTEVTVNSSENTIEESGHKSQSNIELKPVETKIVESSHQESKTENIKQLLKANHYLQLSDVKKIPMNCLNLCSSGDFPVQQYIQTTTGGRIDILIDYKNKEANRAEENFIYALEFNRLKMISNMFPAPVLNLVEQITQPEGINLKQKLKLVATSPVVVFSFSEYLKDQGRFSQEPLNKLNEISSLVSQCGTVEEKILIDHCNDIVKGL